MKILRKIEDLVSVFGPTHLAIGVFDGIHLGHQAVIGYTVRNARQTRGSAVLVTFDPHPIRLLRPASAPRLLISWQQKRQLAEELGLDAMLTSAFTREFSRTAPELFIQKLYNAANGLREICVGQGWRFGAERSGETCLLEVVTQSLGIRLNAVSSVLVDGRPVSGTRVRAALECGDLNEAAKLLGRPFARWDSLPRFRYLSYRPAPADACAGCDIVQGAAWAQEIYEMDSRTAEDVEPFEIQF
jgi:riboflavin kinase/FMN adenylyltransferase